MITILNTNDWLICEYYHRLFIARGKNSNFRPYKFVNTPICTVITECGGRICRSKAVWLFSKDQSLSKIASYSIRSTSNSGKLTAEDNIRQTAHCGLIDHCGREIIMFAEMWEKALKIENDLPNMTSLCDSEC